MPWRRQALKQALLANKFLIRNPSVSWHFHVHNLLHHVTLCKTKKYKENYPANNGKNAKSTYPAPLGTARCSRPEWGPSWRTRSRSGVGLLEEIKVPRNISRITYNGCSQSVYKQCRCVPRWRGHTLGRPILWWPRKPFCENAYRSYRKNGRHSAEGRKLKQEIPVSTDLLETSYFKHVSFAFI
jgi:hypothetical protein